MNESPGVLLTGSLTIAGVCFTPSEAIAEKPRDNACSYVCNATDHPTFVDGIVDPIHLVTAFVAEFRTRGFFNPYACNVLRRATTTGSLDCYLGFMLAFVILNRVAKRLRAVTAPSSSRSPVKETPSSEGGLSKGVNVILS